MSAHIIGRPNDDLLDIMLGHGADPEQAFIRGSEQGRTEDGPLAWEGTSGIGTHPARGTARRS